MKFIQNINEFFSDNFFENEFEKEIISKSGYDIAPKKDDETSVNPIKEINKKVISIKEKYFKFKNDFLTLNRVKDKVLYTHNFNHDLLKVLGYDTSENEKNFEFHLSEREVVPLRKKYFRADKPHLFIMEMIATIKVGDEEPDGLFEQRYRKDTWGDVFPFEENGTKIKPSAINEAISELFLLDEDERPNYVLLLAGKEIFLMHYDKWKYGSYLVLDLEVLFEEAAIPKYRDYLALFYILLSKETLAKDSETIILDELNEDSHKAAYAVTKDLKAGIINAIQLLADESVYFFKNNINNDISLDQKFADNLKNDCLSFVYRLLFIFYAEARRTEIDILPTNDDVYLRGYSLEMLRDLEQVPLNSESARNGYFIFDSLSKLFDLLNKGYRQTNPNDKTFNVKPIDSPLFDNSKFFYLKDVKFRNFVLQKIICELSLSQKIGNKRRGRISYATLGINQLGSVYEGLLAYSGFFADEDYIEVKNEDDKNDTDNTFVVQRRRRDDFKESEIVKLTEDETQDKIIKKGSFVYRLNGRDRQKTASYYTPEILTQTTVKYTLKHILDRDGLKADELLNLKILEPAMGASAFINEVVNQLSFHYLENKQDEIVKSGGKRISPNEYQRELQKVKAFIATNNVYGVDINPTAIELGKLALWLNVIYKDMEIPFFGYKLGVGNAVISCWRKVYKKEDLVISKVVIPSKDGIQSIDSRLHGNDKAKNVIPSKEGIQSIDPRLHGNDKAKNVIPSKEGIQNSKKWWEKAPRELKWNEKRKPDEIYHFLLPDASMVPSAKIALIKSEYPSQAEKVTKWKKEFIKPLSESEFKRLLNLSNEIDKLFKEHYKFQKNVATINYGLAEIWGQKSGVQKEIFNYDYKDKINSARNRNSTPYYKLKLTMDYWCSLWFWELQDAFKLPDRSQFISDLETVILQKGYENPDKVQDLFNYTDNKDLSNERIVLVEKLSQKNRFFHYIVEFIEVFEERGGFDVIVGNPPWVKVLFEEKDVIAEEFPEVVIRKTSAPDVALIRPKYFKDEYRKEVYQAEFHSQECNKCFLNAIQNYPLLEGQQTSIDRSLLVTSLMLINKNGFLGLLHPDGVYDDPKASILREYIYRKLFYHFQFVNEFILFDIGDRKKFSINVYKGSESEPSFKNISNLFHPSTIDGCFTHNGFGICGGIKVKQGENYIWNIKPHNDRIVDYNPKRLSILSKIFENSEDWKGTKLAVIHSVKLINTLDKLSRFKKRVKNFKNIIKECWHETNDVKTTKMIKRFTKYPDIKEYEMILNGPHFYVSDPLYKTPREKCTEKGHFDIIEHTLISENYIARTNYLPNKDILTFKKNISGFDENDDWFAYYKVAFSKMLNLDGDRTLQPSIIAPKISHTNGVISLVFKNEFEIIELCGLASSIVFDYYIKTSGKNNLYEDTISMLPMGIEHKYYLEIAPRVLLLNCLNEFYSSLWKRNFKTEFKLLKWSKEDKRLKSFLNLSENWEWSTPLRNSYERRYALVEIDVISAMAFGLSLDELILISSFQFPVLVQNEDDTYFDQKGNIIFTCNKGLTGVGLTRQEWNKVKDKTEGVVEHIMTSELYRGTKIEYIAPYEKCDRVEDYRRAWAHFEKIFNE